MIEKIGFSLQQLPSCDTSQAHVGLWGPFLTCSPGWGSSLTLKLLLRAGYWDRVCAEQALPREAQSFAEKMGH